MDCFDLAVEIREDDRNAAAKFPDYLPANAAWWCQGFGVGDDGNFHDLSFPLRDRVPDGDTLGAYREAIAGRFDVAAGDYLAYKCPTWSWYGSLLTAADVPDEWGPLQCW